MKTAKSAKAGASSDSPKSLGPLKIKAKPTPVRYPALWAVLGALVALDVVLLVLLLVR